MVGDKSARSNPVRVEANKTQADLMLAYLLCLGVTLGKDALTLGKLLTDQSAISHSASPKPIRFLVGLFVFTVERITMRIHPIRGHVPLTGSKRKSRRLRGSTSNGKPIILSASAVRKLNKLLEN